MMTVILCLSDLYLSSLYITVHISTYNLRDTPYHYYHSTVTQCHATKSYKEKSHHTIPPPVSHNSPYLIKCGPFGMSAPVVVKISPIIN